MFWLILLCLGVGLLGYGYWKDAPGIFVPGLIAAMVSSIALVVVILNGMGRYPSLRGQYSAIQVLESEVEGIKNAYYEENTSPAQIVGGSLTNLKQSTVLSGYLKYIAEKKAKYQKELEKCKVYKELWALRFFGEGLFISEKIFELEDSYKK